MTNEDAILDLQQRLQEIEKDIEHHQYYLNEAIRQINGVKEELAALNLAS